MPLNPNTIQRNFVVVNENQPQNPFEGQIWVDTSDNTTYQFKDNEWTSFEPEVLDQDVVNYPNSLSENDWEKVAEDEIIMDKISENEEPMDEVTDREVAMDKVTDKEVAMDKVTDKEFAMDKVTDKEMAMDKVTDKEVAMDAVSDKEVAMDKVISKEKARTIFFKSEFTDKSWQKETPYIAYENHAIINTDGPEFGFNLDLTGISEIEFEAFNDNEFDELGVRVNDDELLNTTSSSESDYETFTVDVSSYSGSIEVLFTHDGTEDRGGTVEFGNEHAGKLCIRNNRDDDRHTHYTNIRLIEG